MKTVKLTIDGKVAEVSAELTVLQAARSVGIDIPALCYDETLEIFGACRMCVVEIEGTKKLQTSCSTLVKDGMKVRTETEKTINARRDVLQLLLDSHPNDCLTCQKAGECLLQKYSYKYDVAFRKHDGAMRPQLLDTSSPYILKDNSKCILCGKCVLTCSQVSDRRVLAFAERGYDTRIIFGADESIEESPCVSCNRCVAVCPVGALVDKREYNKVRSWESLKKVVSCKACEYGCEFEVHSVKRKGISLVAKAPANGRPLCLKGRLATELKYVDEPETPFRKVDGKFVKTTWDKALGITELLEKIEKLDKSSGGGGDTE